MGNSNGMGQGIANLEDVLTDNDNDSCNPLTPASLHRLQQHHPGNHHHYQSTFATQSRNHGTTLDAASHDFGGGHGHLNQTNSSLSSSPIMQHLMQPYNSSPAVTTTSVESVATTVVPTTNLLLPTVDSATVQLPPKTQTTFMPNSTSSGTKIIEQQQQQSGFGINGLSCSNTMGRKKVSVSSASNGNLCESHGTTKVTNAKGHHTLARLSVDNRQQRREELFLC